jgi:hypothetical protein
MIGPKLPLEESILLHTAKLLAVNMPNHDKGYIDIYIDDSIAVAPDIDDYVTRVTYAVPLAIHAFVRPVDESNTLLRKDLISMKKYIAEGRMEEQKTVLGWNINSRSLSISLPPDKHEKWIGDIDTLLSGKRVSFKQLETMIGRLNHATGIYIVMQHFMGRLNQAEFR